MNKIPENTELKKWYSDQFDSFENKLNGGADTYFHQIRKKAISRFGEIDFPHQKNEDWKYTNISPVLKYNFKPASVLSETKIEDSLIENAFISEVECCSFVFVNGRLHSSKTNFPEGVTAGSLSEIMKKNPELVKQHIASLSENDNSFSALNAAFSEDGFVLLIDKNIQLEKPIQVLFLTGSDTENLLAAPRNLIVAGKNSSAEIIFNYRGFGSKVYLNSSVTEVFADDASNITLYNLQEENDDSFHIEKLQAHQTASSNFTHFSFTLGGKIIRNDINTKLSGENSASHLWGLYLGKNEQLIDHHTFIDHSVPHCESNELFKGILDDNSRGVFNGKILVQKDAQKTNAFQSNKAVLLNKNAKIDTKPQLEIYADDVKCTHGAAIGRLDDTAYFYIRSRGIPADVAKSMQIRAFATDVVEKIEIDELKEIINHKIFEHLRRVEVVNE
ncbi:MAG: Fe-S cluster assembly protein SufD [Ignavibacteria bacterium]|nr:Fe-S cluster assembly protein SufD [Ignavibacteria bacterium]